MTTIEDLSGWERRYLKNSWGRAFIELPRNSKVTDKLLEHGVIERVGLVVGRYVSWAKTPLAHRLMRELNGYSTAHR